VLTVALGRAKPLTNCYDVARGFSGVACAMGCNAWNHSSDCNCGWGGDTGSSNWRSSAAVSGIRQIRWVDGHDWQPEQRPRYESYVCPNARCPVCAADIFFYQSPHGGRVFFDELGPPWPKHRCTETYIRRGSRNLVLPARKTVPKGKPNIADPHVWQPLIPKTAWTGSRLERVEVDSPSLEISGRYLFLPRGFVSEGPAFWRRTPGKASKVDVSTIQIDSDGAVREQLITVSSWYISSEQRRAYLKTRELDGKTLNAIGWSLSFVWRGSSDTRVR
jgi:hypothetical protein